MKKTPVLITTDKSKRGVFMAYINPEDAHKDDIMAEEIRMAVHWSEDVKGVIGLAANGPTKGSRITSPAPRGLIKGVTAVMEITEEAEKAWKKEPWG